jgi:hypothetical protein
VARAREERAHGDGLAADGQWSEALCAYERALAAFTHLHGREREASTSDAVSYTLRQVSPHLPA